MLKKISEFCLSSLMVLTLSSCSLAGSWVYERLDVYIADYFKDFADFSKTQNQEIDRISEEFLDWFSINELKKVRLLLINLKNINIENPENEIRLTYEEGEALFKRLNQYFEKPIINFSRGLNERQINEIAQHFDKIRNEREKERAQDKKEYKERILDNYTSGFDRIGINLRKDQIDELKLRLSNYQEIRQEWVDLEQLWVNEFIQLLRNSDSPDYEKDMTIYLKSFDSLGSEAFRARIEQNENLAIDIISFVFKSSDESQIKGFKRSTDIYLKSIDKILLNRKVN